MKSVFLSKILQPFGFVPLKPIEARKNAYFNRSPHLLSVRLLRLMMVIFTCTLITANGLFSQSAEHELNADHSKGIFRRVTMAKSSGAIFQNVKLFDSKSKSSAAAYSKAVQRGATFDLDLELTKSFLKSEFKQVRLELPSEPGKEPLVLELIKSNVLTPDIKVFTSDNPEVQAVFEDGLHYHGMVAGKPSSLVAISVFKDRVMGLINTEEGNYNLGKLDGQERKHILYLDKDLIKQNDFSCGTIDDGVSYKQSELEFDKSSSAADCPVRLYIEVDKSVYDGFGNVQATMNYVTGLFNQSFVIYANELITMEISEMYIWTTPDPYPGPTRPEFLAQFQAHTGTFNGNIGHLIVLDNVGGQAAGFDGLCNPNTDESLCFSGLSSLTYQQVPIYSFQVYITTHEMGHLLGSRHTHACVWNNNGTAIDGCSGYTELGNCPLPPPANPGTIMSYCQQNMDFNLGFGPQPGNVIRNSVANASCVNDCCTFDVPANGTATVACPAQATAPTPPNVINSCGQTVPKTGPVITNSPNPITCEGTRTFTWTYNPGFSDSKQWSFTYTIERQPFTINTPTGNATVACPDQTDAQPTPPAVTSHCGEPLTPVLVNVTPKPGCEGNRNYTFRYTDCEGNTADWVFIYKVEYQDFTVPASEVVSVECPLNIEVPTPPVVKDNCGKLLTPTGPDIVSQPNAHGCEGSRSFTWTYKDCEGNTHTWGKTFNILYSADFDVYPDGEDFATCVLYAQPPIPPTIYDFCGQVIKVTGPTVTESLSADGCTGWRKFSYVYKDCGGHSHPWTYTYQINDNQGPLGTCPSSSNAAGEPVAINVSNIACIEDVPCPTDYDFSAKVEELLVAGNYFDVCSGDDIIITLDSWTNLWQCSDGDGNGINTFGRTFYFRIADPCGNEYPSLCEVTYSGNCLPLETFPQNAWGVSGGSPGNAVSAATTDIDVIQALLNNGPVVVGGGNRSLTISNAQCVIDLLPGLGGPTMLANCHQTNCMGGCNPAGPGGMKNSLAANAIALTLNLRFNAQYKGLNMNDINNQGLGCLDIHECIYFCTANGDCKLRMFDAAGNAHVYPYTIGGLLEMTNFFLGKNLNLTTGQTTLYATALNASLEKVNAYWDNGQTSTACNPGAGVNHDEVVERATLQEEFSLANQLEISLTPNPAGNTVTLSIAELKDAQKVTLSLYNQLGQLLVKQDYGKVTQLNERIDLTGISGGLHFVRINVGGQHFEQKLVVQE